MIKVDTESTPIARVEVESTPSLSDTESSSSSQFSWVLTRIRIA